MQQRLRATTYIYPPRVFSLLYRRSYWDHDGPRWSVTISARRFCAGDNPKKPLSLFERIRSIFRKPPQAPSLLQSCVSVVNEIVTKACVYIGRECRIAPDSPLPSDYHLIMAYCFLVGVIISASIEEEGAVDDTALRYWTSRHLLGRRADDERDRIINRGWGVAQDTMGLRDADAYEWQSLLALGVGGYIMGDDISASVPGGYPELFGNLLAKLIASEREAA